MLSTAANWAQIIGDVTLLTSAVGFYLKHKCQHCRRPGRYMVGPHRVPTCHRHREREDGRSSD